LDDALTRNSSNPQQELFDPIVKGVRNVIRECAELRKKQDEQGVKDPLKRIIVTSSITAISTEGRFNEKTKQWHYFNETEWNTTASLTDNVYAYCKVMAEKEAFDLLKQEYSSVPLEIVAVLPSTMFGPSLSKRKNIGQQPIISCMKDIPGFFRMYCASIDVRDAAMAHVKAFEKRSVTSNASDLVDPYFLPQHHRRVIAHNDTINTRQICEALSNNPQTVKILKEQKIKLPTISFENSFGDFLFMMGAYFSAPQRDLIRGKELHFQTRSYVKSTDWLN